MTWFRVDDGFPEHPKLEEMERKPNTYMSAITVWTIMGADCARRLTDGYVSAARLDKVLFRLGKAARRGAAALVSAGLWREVEGGWQYHDWNDYQPIKADVEAQRRSKTERQRRWRDGRVDASTESSTALSTRTSRDASRDGPVEGAPTRASPVPSRPVPERKREGAGALSARARPSASPPLESPDETETLTATQLRGLFRSTWMRADRADPPMPAEDKLAELAERVTDTAAQRRVAPAELLVTTLERWAKGERNARELRAPVQCFAQAFGEVLDQESNGAPRLSPSDALNRKGMEAMRAGDFDRYDAIQAELRALNGGGSHV
jgi:hypothetical protein